MSAAKNKGGEGSYPEDEEFPGEFIVPSQPNAPMIESSKPSVNFNDPMPQRMAKIEQRLIQMEEKMKNIEKKY